MEPHIFRHDCTCFTLLFWWPWPDLIPIVIASRFYGLLRNHSNHLFQWSARALLLICVFPRRTAIFNLPTTHSSLLNLKELQNKRWIKRTHMVSRQYCCCPGNRICASTHTTSHTTTNSNR